MKKEVYLCCIRRTFFETPSVSKMHISDCNTQTYA